MMRIDTHHHAVPSFYRDLLQKTGMDKSGGRAVPEWSPESSLVTMAELGVATAILSVSTPGTTILTSPADSAALARDLNDYLADLVAAQRDRFGFFATIPMPHIGEAVDEVVRSLDKLHADGVVLLGNSAGTYLGQDGQDDLFAALDARSAVVFIHPGDLPGAAVAGIPPFAADFLLDTTRAAFLLVRNEIRRNYPRIRFILSHAGGFVPYASHRMAVAIMGDTGRGRKAVRGRLGDLPRPRRRGPRGDRAHQCAATVPPSGDGGPAAGGLGGRSGPPRGQQSRHARYRAINQRPVTGSQQGLLPGEDAFGQLGPAVFLDEMTGPDASMRLAGGTGDVLDQGAIGLPQDRIAISEDGEEGFLPSAQGIPRRAIGRNRRIVR